MVYSLQKGQRPKRIDEALYRSADILKVFNKQDIKDTNPHYGEICQCGGFRHFTLYLFVDSTGTPTDLHIEPEYLNPNDGTWHSYKQGIFASFFYEDTDVASGVYEVFSADNVGREFRLKITGSGCDAQSYFTIAASVEFWN